MELKQLLEGWAQKEAQPSVSFLNFNWNDVIVISGLRDTGKSFFLNEYILQNASRFILWDSRYERVYQITPNSSKKAKIITKDIKITSLPNDIGKHNKIVFHPFSSSKEEMLNQFDTICKNVYKTKNYILALEEADSICDRFHPLQDGIFELVQGNLHVNCGLVFLTRRLQNLNPDIVRQADKLVIFRYSSKDKEYLEGYIGIDELKPSIPNRAFYIYDGANLRYYKELQV